MRKKIFIFCLTIVFLLSQIIVVDARGFGSRSSRGFFGSSSSRSSGGFFGSSRSKSSGGWFGSSGSKSSGSSRSVPKSFSWGGSKRSSAQKKSYMQDAYKKQASASNFKAYKQNLNTDQQRVYNSGMNKSYNVNNKMNFEDAMRTRNYRASTFSSRPVRVHVNNNYFGGPLGYGSAFVGPWDLMFLMMASDMFWHHHWNDISPYRDHFNAAEFAEMEARVKSLEEQGVERDPNYLEPGVDPDLQFSRQYVEKNPDSIYYTSKYSGPSINLFSLFVIIIVIVVILVIILKAVSRARPRRTYHRRIY